MPQIGTAIPLCSTMWSLNSAAGLTSAGANAEANRERRKKTISVCVLEIFHEVLDDVGSRKPILWGQHANRQSARAADCSTRAQPKP